jgi:hypothetical protein
LLNYNYTDWTAGRREWEGKCWTRFGGLVGARMESFEISGDVRKKREKEMN